MPWFRFYVETPTDPKIRRLRKGDYKWLWCVLMCVARQSPVPGVLMLSESEPIQPDDLADLADLPVRTVNNGLEAMQKLGLIEPDLDRDSWVLPAFQKRQFKSDDVTARTRKHRRSNRLASD